MVKHRGSMRQLREHIASIAGGLVDLVYPPVCLLCETELSVGALCHKCVQDFQPVHPPFCDRCGEPISVGKIVCRRCEVGPGPAYDWAQAPFQYDGPMLRAIHRFKYDGKTALAEPLGLLLSQSLDVKTSLVDPDRDPGLPLFDLLIPVPLHGSRLRRRGFNQAERIALVVARERGLTLETNAIRRVRATRTQTAMSEAKRAANMRGAFHVADPGLIERKSILVIDDVLTSTNTAREVARTIAGAGATRVCVLALARSV